MRLSLVIPAYNEAARIGPTLEQARDYLRRHDGGAEIIVVDDGSTDGTADVVRRFESADGPAVRLHVFPENRGKGAAVREGMLRQAAGDFRFFTDADGSTPVEEMEKCGALFGGEADIVIGSRALPESRIEIHQAWHRERMGRMFNTLLRTVRLTRFRDTQCGFKGFTADAAERCFSRQTLDGFSFDVEVLFIAGLQGLRVREVPVVWRNSPQSRVHACTDSTRMFRDALRIRLNAGAGRYR